MKKILTIAITFVMVAMVAVSSYATTSSELADTLYNKGSKYGMTSADKVKIERYLADNPVTDAEANSIVAKADEAVKVMENAGVTSYKDLTAEQKSELKTIANEAASVAGLTLKFGTSSVEIYKDGKLIETVTSNNGKLAYTGSNTAIVVVSSLAIIALVAVVAKKRLSIEG
mgnify:CR=1 FL=1